MAKVEIRFDGGIWRTCSGTESWTYDWVSYEIAGDETVTADVRITGGDASTINLSRDLVVSNPKVQIPTGAHIVCIGDSITYGEAASTDWPSELQAMLNIAGRTDVTVHNEGEGGLSSEEFWTDAASEGNKKSDVAAYANIHIAFVMLGHNDTRTDPIP